MDLDRALAYSRYAHHALIAHPALRTELASSLDAPFDWTHTFVDIDAALAADDAARLAAALRALRRRAFLHTLARDLTGRADFPEVVGTMTTLAERALAAAVELHSRALAGTFGMPRGDASGEPQQLIVVAMGKLGGGELNVSSDIDVVFVYPEEGETDGIKRISNREFFDRLAPRIVGALDQVDANGYVFRVDTRLRPYGESGPPTVSFAALERYLVTQGRAWERYAWLKARPLTGERHDELAALVMPFVYRKYLDYDAYEGLRAIHRQIREQERRYGDDIKLGPGGIREMEFVIQALQIVRGGREPALRARGTLPALAALAERTIIAPHAAGVLHDAYLFLRSLEHRLQYRDDRQTQRLPAGDERALVAEALDFGSVEAFDCALAAHRSDIAGQFNAVFDAPADSASDIDRSQRHAALWDDPQPTPEALDELTQAGFSDAADVVQSLARMRASRRYLQLPALSRDRFDRLVPQLVGVASEHRGPGASPAVVLSRLLGLLEAISGRSAYLALLTEHPPLLPRLAQLMAASAWAADYLTRRPLVLDELLDARVLLAEPDWTQWREELDRALAPHAHDAEAAMDALRHFQHAQVFRLLTQDLAGRMSVERLADHLSALADAILDATLRCCWRQLQGDDAMPPRFAIVAYGKLGGKELGYVSDLDLVFVYDDDPLLQDADDAFVRHARLGQRINTWLSAATGAGRLYETDLRLRPDGAKGLLVSGMRAFERYQREQAWIWEHQALTRARAVAGDPSVGAAFEAIRDSLLRLPRDRGRLAADIAEMRERMAAGHLNRTEHFDIKHDRGGMVDIEFAVQFIVLAYACEHHELTRNAGNIALLSLAADADLLPRALVLEAADAYRTYRRLQHQVRLTGAAHARVDAGAQATRRACVGALWRHVFGAPRNG